MKVRLYSDQFKEIEKRIPRNLNVSVKRTRERFTDNKGFGWFVVDLELDLVGMDHILGRLYSDGLYIETNPTPPHYLTQPHKCSKCGVDSLQYVTVKLDGTFLCDKCLPIMELPVLGGYFSVCFLALEIRQNISPKPDIIPLDIFLAYCFEYLEVEEWKGAREKVPSCSEIHSNMINNLTHPKNYHFEIIPHFKNWLMKNIKERDESSEDSFFTAAEAILQKDELSLWEMPYMASIAHKYIIINRKGVPQSEYVGDIGQRMNLINLKVLDKKIVNGFRGRVSNMYKLQDPQSNILVWFTDSELIPGQCYDGKATIKKHSEFRGVKETQISRCSLTLHE